MVLKLAFISLEINSLSPFIDVWLLQLLRYFLCSSTSRLGKVVRQFGCFLLWHRWELYTMQVLAYVWGLSQSPSPKSPLKTQNQPPFIALLSHLWTSLTGSSFRQYHYINNEEFLLHCLCGTISFSSQTKFLVRTHSITVRRLFNPWKLQNLWWLLMLSIFLCATYNLLRNVYSNLLTNFNWVVFLLLNCNSCMCILDTSPLLDIQFVNRNTWFVFSLYWCWLKAQ